MPKIFIGSIKKYSKTRELMSLISNIPKIKSAKLVYPKAQRLTRGFVIVSIKFRKGMNSKKLKRLGLKFNGEKLHIAPYLKGDDLKQRDLELAEKKLFISKIPPITTKKDLMLLFSQFGDVETAYICNERTKTTFLYGFVTFFKISDAKKCLNAKKIPFLGTNLGVKKFTPKSLNNNDEAPMVEEERNAVSYENGLLRLEREQMPGEAPWQGGRPSNWIGNVREEAQRQNSVGEKKSFIKRKIPDMDFSVKDGIGEVIEVSNRILNYPSNLRFNQRDDSDFGKRKSNPNLNSPSREEIFLSHGHSNKMFDSFQCHTDSKVENYLSAV